MNRLIFGASYDGLNISAVRVQRDMELMAEAGFNTLRLGLSAWSTLEPKYGEYDFTPLTEIIDAADRHGMDVIVAAPINAIPVWLANLSPGILDGGKYGPARNFDFTDPTYRRCAEKLLRELVANTIDFPSVIGYQLDCETRPLTIANERIIAGFRKWLRKNFETIEDLNQAYGLASDSNAVSSFDELPDPTGAVNAGYESAFARFRRAMAGEFLHWQAGIFSELKREDQFITYNLEPEWIPVGTEPYAVYSGGINPGINHFDTAADVTAVGVCVSSPAGDGLTGQEIAFTGDLSRCLKGGNYLVLAAQAQGFDRQLPYPGQLRLMALSHIAAGAGGILYHPWMSPRCGSESYHKGVLSHDGEPDQTYQEISALGAELGSLSTPLAGLRKRARVAIVVNVEALQALERFPTEPGLSYNDVVWQFHTALYEMNFECDILYEQAEDWSGYDLLIFPQMYCCSEALLSRIRNFAAAGGTVLATYRSFFADENLQIHPDSQPHGMTDLFGMRYSRFTKSEDGHWMELLEPDRAAAAGWYDHRYWGGVAAATRCRYGRGNAWYLGTRLEKRELKDFLVRVFESAGLYPLYFRWPVICRWAVSQQGLGLCFLLNFSREKQTIRCPANGADLLTGQHCRSGQEITLNDWGAAIIQQERS